MERGNVEPRWLLSYREASGRGKGRMRAGPGDKVRNNFGASGERRVLPELQAMKFKAAGVFQAAVEAM
jgi:hypothetical protein